MFLKKKKDRKVYFSNNIYIYMYTLPKELFIFIFI